MNPLTTQDDIDHAATRQDHTAAAARHRNDANRDTPRLTAFDRIAELSELIASIDTSLASPWCDARDAAYQTHRRVVLVEALDREVAQLCGLTVVAVSDRRAA